MLTISQKKSRPHVEWILCEQYKLQTMKNDKEPADSPYYQDSSSEIVSFSDHHLEAESVKPDIEVNNEEPSGFISLREYLRRERDLELVRQGEEPKSVHNSNVDDSTVLVPTHSPHMAISTLLPPKFELPRKETEFYMDKEVTEVERSKVFICFQKDADQSVKDICIDERSSNKGFRHIEKVEHEKVYTISPLMENEDVESNKILPFDCSESVHVVENPALSFDKKDSLESKMGEVDDNMNDNITDSANVGPPQQELHYDQLLADSSCSNDEIKPAEVEHLQEQFSDCIDGLESTEADQDPLTVANTTVPESSTDKMNGSEISEAIPLNYHEQENSSILDSVVNTERPAIATEKPNDLASELHQPFQGNVGSTYDQDSTDTTTLPRNSLIPYGQMEVVMHGPSSLPDRIMYTGQGAYSGSISHRSDSSTTSARSFAFPILHSEWTSSPVKMAKPDRRRYRKCRGWSARLLCCRF